MWLKLIMQFSSAYVNEPLSIYKKYRGSLARHSSNYYKSQIIFLGDVLASSGLNGEVRKLLENSMTKTLSAYSFELFREAKYNQSHKNYKQLLKKKVKFMTILMLIITILPANLIELIKKFKESVHF